MAITKVGKGHKRTRKSHLQSDLTECDLSLSLPPILPQASTICCSFGSVTVNERVSPGRMGRSPERRQPVQERFQIVLWAWNGPAWYMTGHSRGRAVKTNREGHRGLAGRRIVGGWQRKVQGLLKLVVEVKLNNLVAGRGF
jgi:hypothetical protein